MLKTTLVIATLMLTGCASLNDSLTPNLTIEKDKFEGYLVISQPVVSSSSSISEDWHTLGFTWYEDVPKSVYLTVGVKGIQNVQRVSFNIDGDIIKGVKAGYLTSYGEWSTGRFYMDIDDFNILSKGKNVKMKVESIDEYTVSSFGTLNTGATVNSKFIPFIEQLIKHKALNDTIAYNQ